MQVDVTIQVKYIWDLNFWRGPKLREEKEMYLETCFWRIRGQHFIKKSHVKLTNRSGFASFRIPWVSRVDLFGQLKYPFLPSPRKLWSSGPVTLFQLFFPLVESLLTYIPRTRIISWNISTRRSGSALLPFFLLLFLGWGRALNFSTAWNVTQCNSQFDLFHRNCCKWRHYDSKRVACVSYYIEHWWM